MGSTKKIIWPIDPANSNQQLDKELRKFIKNLSNQEAIEVYPVCVCLLYTSDAAATPYV